MKRTSSQLKQLARESLAHRFSLPVMAYVITFGIIMLVNMLLGALFPDTGNSISYLVISFITDLLLSILSVGPVTILLDMSRGSDGQLSDLLYAFRHQPDRIIVSQLIISILSTVIFLPGIIVFVLSSVFYNAFVAESGGYIRTRTVGGVHYIDYLAEYEQAGGQDIRQGQNIIDVTKNVKTDDLATRLIPLGSSTSNNEWPVTIANVNGGKDYLEDAAAVKEYGIITKTVEFSEIQDPTKLKEEGEKAFKKINGANLVTELSAIDLSDAGYDVDMLRIGEKVFCAAPTYNIQQQLQITKKVTDLLKPANSKVTLGGTALTYTQQQLQAGQGRVKYATVTAITNGQIDEICIYS